MPDDLYDRDVLIWSEQQAALLRRLADGERVNLPVDWPNVIEEIESVGRAELHACQSLIRKALVHLLTLRSDPSEPATHWRAEIVAFLGDARDRFSPSMRHRIDIEKQFRRASAQAADLLPGWTPPETCPVTLDDLLTDPVDIAAFERRFAVAAP